MEGDHAGFRNFGTYSAQPPVDDRTRPDTAGLNEDRPPTVFTLVEGRSRWCGGSRIRTLVGVRRRIYSPLPYTAHRCSLNCPASHPPTGHDHRAMMIVA